MKRVLEYIHRPNKTEVGVDKNIHDTYLKLPLELESSDIFKKGVDDEFFNHSINDNLVFKAIKYTSGTKEYRLTKLGAVREKIELECGDDLIFRREIGEGVLSKPIFEVNHYKKTMFYPITKDEYAVVYPERIPGWNEENETLVNVMFNGNEINLKIKFVAWKKKRSDSPDVTPFYNISLNGRTLSKDVFCLKFEKGRMVLETQEKWSYSEIEV